MWGQTRRRHPRTQTLCVTGGRGLGLWLISPGGLFRPVEIENNLKVDIGYRDLEFYWHGEWQRNVQVSLHGGQGPKLPVSGKKNRQVEEIHRIYYKKLK